ncbi:expressed hypothetical protein [Trichoplax adhaerens]|uniref:Nicolin-1 n=1 Tax=Trichoplax adhaerens TaxID=10228 RepID=B3RV17_TRIAD|nr:expressed hypothetical protein [Trichoplax adhaerens]EDV25419.1 expressed hypothetical protein [Trichoplax adhaerens]|eukprot:XP_002111452.1 expressed hypothetical protein [Trichoplax adhaerens]
MAGKDAIVCRFKNPLIVKIDTHDNLKSGCSVIEVNFPHSKPLQLGKIQFSNNYSAYLTIKAQFKETSDESAAIKNTRKWITLIKNKQLMPNVHCDVSGRDHFTITREEMLEKPDNILYMRLILRQPSPIWLQFSIENIKLSPKNDSEGTSKEGNRDVHLPSRNTTVTKNASSSVYPDPTKIASSLQNLWALMYSKRTGAPPPFLKKLEVDGSYEVSTLSYT